MITDNTALTWAIFLIVGTIFITACSTIQEYMWQKNWENETRDDLKSIIYRTIAPSFTLAFLITIITFIINLFVNDTPT